jgi:malonate-semialdehyde dehydrogenase (acetylating)/methylmalonate-semialdehyde dehydrogenase
VDALINHSRVAAISFVGSTNVAKYIYERGTAAGKRVQSAGGAKNHLIIMPDADMDQTVKALAVSAYGCAGQRCMAGSVAVAVGGAGDPVVEGLVGYADRLRVFDSDGFLLGPSVVDRVRTSMRVWREEIFGPVLSVLRVTDLDEALAIGERCEYGNGAAIFTRSGYAARVFQRRFNAGMIGINVGVPAPMAWFPFTGWNRSFFGDLHIQGTESIQFYTRQKVTLTRWPKTDESYVDPVWRQDRK